MIKVRGFEKISIEQFKKDIELKVNETSEVIHAKFELPRRGTLKSAGYDFYALQDIVLEPGKEYRIPTGVKSYMQDDEWLSIRIRSSLGFKHNIRLKNQVGVIDGDYYNNVSNEGHIWVALKNEGENTVVINKGKAFCQGIFEKFYLADNDRPVSKKRVGGEGSTDKK